jgi:hypothetical protein
VPLEVGVHLVHETIEVSAALGGLGQAGEEQIHQPGLAAADAAPQVHALGRAVAIGQAAQQAFAERRGRRLGELGAQPFELGDGGELSAVRGKSALGDFLGVERAEEVGRGTHNSW